MTVISVSLSLLVQVEIYKCTYFYSAKYLVCRCLFHHNCFIMLLWIISCCTKGASFVFDVIIGNSVF
ncbi:hypothetical protein RJT34_27472 [Clitoria ternatea]|uniref:Uncharacterized protein n=1 Tax=Clitoria ternatea TaxID=43366 RepID=A0AAN9IC30_CLITE